MPRKHHLKSWTVYKPSAPTPPTQTTQTTEVKSVNSLLHHLRTSQPHLSDSDAPPPRTTLPAPALPPQISSLLGAALPPAPRPRRRPGHVITLPRVPGPAAPASWSQSQLELHPPSASSSSTPPPSSSTPTTVVSAHTKLSRLPGLNVPAPNSLFYHALRTCAQHWTFTAAAYSADLPFLPGSFKSLLISAIGLWGVTPIMVKNLRDLGGDDVTHLDLSGVLSGMGLGALIGVWNQVDCGGDLPDVWDYDAGGPSRGLFPSLTHLSLAWPCRESADWRALAGFLTGCCAGLTHLSLAGWPVPAREGTLMRLARALVCIRWVEVTGLEICVDEVEWAGVWRGVEEIVVDVGKGKEVAGMVKRVRKEKGKGGWVNVVERGW